MEFDGLKEYLSTQRNKNFAVSAQITLGEIIEKLKKCELTYGDENKDKSICFDFGSAVPTDLDSWRGSYNELALGYRLTGCDSNNKSSEITAKMILKEMESAVGKEYTGWKGGEFIMSEKTPVWVANPGNSGSTGVIDVVEEEYRIILITAYCEY